MVINQVVPDFWLPTIKKIGAFSREDPGKRATPSASFLPGPTTCRRFRLPDIARDTTPGFNKVLIFLASLKATRFLKTDTAVILPLYC